MKLKYFLLLVVGILTLTCAYPVFSQVNTRTGTIYGKVVDEKGAPLPGVTITLESTVIPSKTATTAAGGAFRFAALPPGYYSLNYSLEGFTEVRQEEIEVRTGSSVDLSVTLKPTLTEEFTVIGETPAIDTAKTGNEDNFNREYLDQVPTSRDPWAIIDQTSGVDNDRYNVAGSESGSQSQFVARGASNDATQWNYDGVNATDPQALGASPTYFDFDAFEEMSIVTGASDASVGSAGVNVNIVTKRGGNKWAGNASYFYANDSMQSSNAPTEALRLRGAIRIDEIEDYGFDLGGPIWKDKVFVWGAYRKNNLGIFTTGNTLDKTQLKDWNFKANVNENASNESQFGYFRGEKTKENRATFSAAQQEQGTLFQQGGPKGITPGIWTGQHTWIPNDSMILTGRYGYIGLGFDLSTYAPETDPAILMALIPRWETNWFSFSPIQRPADDWSVDFNYFRDNMMGGDHELKFGFEYKVADVHTGTAYANGQYMVDTGQIDPSPTAPLTYGYIYLLHNLDGRFQTNFTSFYANDTYRRDRLTLNFGLRFDHQTGSNTAATIGGVAGFEDIVGPIDYAGSDPGVSFDTFSPRLGATYSLTADGKTIVRGNYARYYGGFDPAAILIYSNPTFSGSGANFTYQNLNGDRTITPDEFTSGVTCTGGLTNVGGSCAFDLAAYNLNRLYSDNLSASHTNEFIAGFEREIMRNTTASVTYTYRNYGNFLDNQPFGVTSADYLPAGVFHAETVQYGTFDVPYFKLPSNHNGVQILRNIDDYNQTYQGLDLNLRRRMSNNLMLFGSFVYQKQKAHYNGGDAAAWVIPDGGLTGQTFPFDPTNVPFANDQTYAYAPGGSGKSGVYPFSEWQLKFSGVYQLPWQMSVGGFLRYQQGYIQLLFGDISDGTFNATYATTHHLILVEPFGSRRYDNIFTVDLSFEKDFNIGRAGQIGLMADLFNLTNTNTTIQQARLVNSTSGRLGTITEYIAPRALKIGVRYSF
jgi:hypothetical protein